MAVRNGETPPKSAISAEEPLKYHTDIESTDTTIIANIPPKQNPETKQVSQEYQTTQHCYRVTERYRL